MPEKLFQVRAGSLRRRLAALVATVMFVGLGVGLSAPAAQAAEDKVIVTFTFDDARDSQYPMLPIFATHGAKATFYVNSGLMGTNGVMTWSQLRDIYGAGHEIGGHTAHHTPLTDVDEATARAEIEADVTTLQAQGFPRPVSFAYPIGYYGPAEEEMVEEAGYASGRTIDTDRRETAPPADPYAMRIVRDSLDGSEGLQALKNDVMAAEAASGTTWLVYLMHEFYSPIDEEIDDFLTWLGPRKASGTVVKTVRDVMLPAGPLPPVAEAGPDQTVAVGSGVSLDGSGSRDPNGDQLTYQWTQTAGPSVSLSSATAPKPTFTAPATTSTLTFRLTVGDGGFTTSDTVTVTVAADSGGGKPTYRSSSSTGNDSWSTAATVAVPAGATTGDVVLASVATWGSPAPAVAPPAGFTLKATHTSGADTVRVYWKRLTAPESGTYSFSWSGGRWSSAQAMAVSGAATIGDPLEAIDHASSGSGTAFPTTTVSTASTPLLVWIGRNDEPASGHTPPTGFTEVQDRDCTAFAYRAPAAAGTHAASSAAYSGSAGPLHSVLVAVKGGVTPPVNRAPVASAGAAQSVSAAAVVTLDGSGSSDPDGDALTFGWVQTAGPVVTLSSASVAKPTFTAPSSSSSLAFRLTVGDGQATASDTVTVTVTAPPPVNRAPVASAGAAQSVSAAAVVTLDGSGSSDPDGDALTFGWVQTAGPVVTLSSASVAKPTFTAPSSSSSLAFRLTVGDGQATASDTVTVTVTAPPPVNRAPVASAGAAQSVSAAAVVTLDGSGSSDPDGDALTFGWVQTAGPVVTLSSASVAKPTFTAPSSSSSLAFRLTVGDGQATASDTVTVTVTAPPPVNRAPVASAGAAQSVSAAAVVTLDGSGSSDPDGDALTFGWVQTAGPVVTLSSASVAKPTFTAPSSSSSLAFRLTVGDGQATASDTVTVTVTAPPPVNRAPVASAGAAQSVSAAAVVTLDGSGSSDPDGDALTFGWVQTAGPVVTLSSASVAKPTFTAPSSSSSLAFRLTVGDGQATASDTVTVTVTAPPPVNRAPVASAGAAQSVSAAAVVTLDGSGSSDPDGDALTFGWVQTAGPVVTLSSASVAKPTFTAPSSSSSLAFRLTVGDGQATASDTVTVTVTAPPPVSTPTYRASSSTGNDVFASAANVPVPAGATTGDVVIATVATWGNGTAPPVTAPAGFTLKATYTGANSGGADTLRVYWKRLTAPDTGSYPFTWSGKRWSSGHAIAVSGAGLSGDPIAAIDRAGSASATTFPVTTVTTSGSAVLAWVGRDDEPTSQHTPPTGFTEVQDKDCTTLAVRSASGAGTYTATGASYTGKAGPLQSVLLAIR